MSVSPDDAQDNHPDNKKSEHEGWTDIKDKKRESTDCFMMILLIVCWIIMTAVGFIVCGVVQSDQLREGNPSLLTNPMDYKGRVCGVSSGVTNKPYGYYMPDTSVVCVSSCPSTADYTQFYCMDDNQAAADAAVAEGYNLMTQNVCMVKIKTTQVLNRCALDSSLSDIQAGVDAACTSGCPTSISYSSSSNDTWVTSFLADIWNFQGYIFGYGIGIATLIAFLYLYLLRIPGILFGVIWGIVVSIQVLLIIGAVLLWDLSTQWMNDSTHTDIEAQTMNVLGYTVAVIAVLYFCLMIVLRKRIQLAIAIVKEAARALGMMPIMIFTPIFQVSLLVVFLVPWLIYLAYLTTSGKISVVEATYIDSSGATQTYYSRSFSYDTNTNYAFVYMIFCYFWTSEFIIACGQLMIALSVVAWYFTREKGKIGNGTVLWAAKTTGRYHLGTAAFGSLVIAIVKTIRAIISYLQKKAKKSGNKILQYVLCVLQCCMWCLEKCMKFLNKNAYIQTAIYGYSFCKAARKAFFLILRNILRVAAVNMVAEFVLLLGKLFVPVFTTFLLYITLAYAMPNAGLNGLFGPLIFTFILAYFVSGMFSEIFGMTIETLLCCYIADEEMFPAEDRFADGPLKNAMQKTQGQAADGGVKVVPVRPAEATGGGEDELM